MDKYLLSLFLIFFSLSISANSSPIPENERIFILSKIWSEIKYNSAGIEKFDSTELDAAYKSSILEASEAEDFYIYFNVLRRFVARANDTHTSLWLDQAVLEKTIARPPMTLIEAGGKVYVRSVSRELVEKIPLGSRVVAIDGIDAEEYIAKNATPLVFSAGFNKFRRAVPRSLEGQPHTSVKISYINTSNETATVTLQRLLQSELDKISMQNLYVPWESALFKSQSLNGKIFYVGLNSFENKEILTSFEKVIGQIKDAQSLIIDLRFNTGGNSEFGLEILGYFADRKTKATVSRYLEYSSRIKSDEIISGKSELMAGRKWNSTTDYISPKKPYLHKQVVVLIGRNTASAAEDFVAATKNLPMFTSVGECTDGGTGQPLNFSLGYGINFRVVTNQTLTLKNENYSNTGLCPDIAVDRNIEDLLAKKDITLEHAIRHLENQHGNHKSM